MLNNALGESDVITLYCQPGQRLHKPFLSFNTIQKPRIKSLGILRTKIIMGVHQTFSFPSKYKEEKAVWLSKTTQEAEQKSLMSLCDMACTTISYSYRVLK